MRHPIRYRTRLHFTAALCILLALLVPTFGADAARPHQAAGATPVYGGTFRSAFTDDYTFLDPAEASGSDSITIYYTMFDGIYKFDRSNQPQLDLATAAPTISADRKTWTFSLRKDVMFSNGMPMTADDVKYSIVRMLDPKLGPPVSYCQSANDIYVGSHDYITGKAKDVSGIQVVDPYTIRFVLTNPTVGLSFLPGGRVQLRGAQGHRVHGVRVAVQQPSYRYRPLHAAVVSEGRAGHLRQKPALLP